MKANIINENISITNKINKKKKRPQSLLYTDNKSLLDFSNKLNDNNGILKNYKNINLPNFKRKNHRLATIEVSNQNQILANYEVNSKLNNDLNESKKVKFNLNKLKKQKENNESEKKENNIELKQNEDGVKYILFTFKNAIKKKFKKEKWLLVPSETTSIFLKEVQSNNSKKNKKNIKNNKINYNNEEKQKDDKNINNIIEKSKNKTILNKIYKVKEDNKKIQKLKKKNDFKKYSNKNDESEDEYENSESSSSSNITNSSNNNDYFGFKNFNKKIEKNDKDIAKNLSKKEYYGSSQNINKTKDKEDKKLIIKNNSVENNNIKEKYYKKNSNDYKSRENEINNNEISYNINPKKQYKKMENQSLQNYNIDLNSDYKRKDKKDYTIGGKNHFPNHDFIELEDNSKNIHKVRYKKAKIIKFKSSKENFDTQTLTKRQKNLYDDYYNFSDTTLKYDNNKKLKTHKKNEYAIKIKKIVETKTIN